MAEDVVMRDIEEEVELPDTDSSLPHVPQVIQKMNEPNTSNNIKEEASASARQATLQSSTSLAKTAEIANSSDGVLRASQSFQENSFDNLADPGTNIDLNDAHLVSRSRLWHEEARGPVGVCGLGNVSTVKQSIVSYFPELATTVDVNTPAQIATVDSNLKPLLAEFKFEDLEAMFTRDFGAESKVLGVDPKELEAEAKDAADGKRRKKTTYGFRSEDEEQLVMEDRELTLDDIDSTLVMLGIEKKRSRRQVENSLLAYLRDNYKLSPQAIGRFNRREEFWKIIFTRSSEANRLVDTSTKFKFGDEEVEVEFRRPVMYKIVHGDQNIDVSQEKRNEVISRVRSLNEFEQAEKKRKEIERDEHEAKKRSRIEPSTPEQKKLAPVTKIDLTKVKEEVKKEIPKPAASPAAKPKFRSERDSGQLSLPPEIHVIPHNANGKYFPEDEAKLRNIKVILRARRMEQDGSLWFLCGPLTAKITHDGVTDVTWIESMVVMEKNPKLVLKFFGNVIDWTKGEILSETVDL